MSIEKIGARNPFKSNAISFLYAPINIQIMLETSSRINSFNAVIFIMFFIISTVDIGFVFPLSYGLGKLPLFAQQSIIFLASSRSLVPVEIEYNFSPVIFDNGQQ